MFLLKTDLISITAFCIFNNFYKGKSSTKLILIFIYLSEQMSEILLFNIISYLILSKILSHFSSECSNIRHLVLSYFLVYSSTLPKIIHKILAPYRVLYATI